MIAGLQRPRRRLIHFINFRLLYRHPSKIEGEYVNEAGETVAVDPCVAEAGPSVLLADVDQMQEMLRRQSLSLIWTTVAEKNVSIAKRDKWLGKMSLEGIYFLDKNKIVGKRKFVRVGP